MRNVPLFSICALAALLLSACSAAASEPASAPETSPTAIPVPETIGAGFRFSSYGPGYNPGTEYWVQVGRQMAAKFENAQPETVWIVGELASPGVLLTFPGSSENLDIHFAPEDRNEEALTRFDEEGVRVWLQVEPGNAPVDELIRIILTQYGHHPCVMGVGVDVEWYQSPDSPEGTPVSDEVAAEWLAVARGFNPGYRLFLKHWEPEMMPPTLRDGLMFIDDSQELESLDAMVDEFAAWGEHFYPAPVGFQYGYDADERWWGELDDPAREIGQALLERIPNTAGLYWVDFTVLRMFPPEE